MTRGDGTARTQQLLAGQGDCWGQPPCSHRPHTILQARRPTSAGKATAVSGMFVTSACGELEHMVSHYFQPQLWVCCLQVAPDTGHHHHPEQGRKPVRAHSAEGARLWDGRGGGSVSSPAPRAL